MSRRPPLVWLVLVPTALLSLLAARHPGILLALRRDPEALRAGQWWRVISPVLVQPDAAWAVAGLLWLMLWLCLAAERALGARAALTFYVLGALVGHTVGMAWQPYGAGCSVAGCAMLGGLAVWLLRRRASPPPRAVAVGAAVLVVGGGVALAVLRDIHGPPLLAGAALVALRRR